MFCTNCGTSIAEGAAFCRMCGEPVTQPPAVAPEGATLPPAATAVASPIVAPLLVTAPAPPVAPIPPPLYYPYAGFWLRLIAYLIDSAVYGAVVGILFLIPVAILGVGFFRDLTLQVNRENPVFPLMFAFVIMFSMVAMFVLAWLYYACMESSAYQGTLGKIALGLIVTDMQGCRISFGRASGRLFAKIITGLVPLFIGYIMAGFTERKQALHDIIAGCLVLKKI
jgi:uncharacterized RDD family membrane protein YckC